MPSFVSRRQLKYRDNNHVVRTTEKTVSYKELVRKEKHNTENEASLAIQHESCSIAHRSLVEAAHLLRKLDRQGAQKLLQVIKHLYAVCVCVCAHAGWSMGACVSSEIDWDDAQAVGGWEGRWGLFS